MKWLKSPKFWCWLAALLLAYAAIWNVFALKYLLENPHLYQTVCGPEHAAVTAVIVMLSYILAVCFFLFPPKYTPMIWVGTILSAYWLLFLSDSVNFLHVPESYRYPCSRLYEFEHYFYSDIRAFFLFAAGLALCYYLPQSHRKRALAWLAWVAAFYIVAWSNAIPECLY